MRINGVENDVRIEAEREAEENLNNFSANLPGENGWSDSLYYSLAEQNGKLDTPCADMQNPAKKHGSKKPGQTWREFFQTIQDTINDEGFDIIEMHHILQEVKSCPPGKKHSELFKKYREFQKPLYVALRRKGYTPDELIS